MTDQDARSIPGRERRVRGLTQIGACATALGIAIAAAGDDVISPFLTIGGVVALVAALHRFGRLGADAPIEPAAPRDEAR